MKQLLLVFDIYHDPNVLEPLIEEKDYNSNNVFYYFLKYDMIHVLKTSIMDRYITDKWLGRLELNRSMLDFSSGYVLIQDRFQYFKTDLVFY